MSTEKHTNEFQIKDKAGKVIFSGTLLVFRDGAFPGIASKTALQIIVPEKYNSKDFTINLIVKDSNQKVIYDFNLN